MIALVPMDDAQYRTFSAAAVRDYAADKVTNGLWLPDEAQTRAQASFDVLLPAGLRTPGHHFYCLTQAAGDVPVGTLWLAVQDRAGQPVAHVYGIAIHAPHLRKGYATQAFAALEEKIQALGLAGIALHVFGHNQGALALYEGLGFQTTDITMFRPSGRSTGSGPE